MYFEIKERIGTISENALWNKEVNIVTWGNRPEKYDIRSWKNEQNIAGKGIALTKEELIKLRELLNKLDLT